MIFFLKIIGKKIVENGDLDEFDDIPNTQSWKMRAIKQMKQMDPLLPEHITNSIDGMTVNTKTYNKKFQQNFFFCKKTVKICSKKK